MLFSTVPLSSLKSILERGLLRSYGGGGAKFGGAHGETSKGKIYVTDADGALYWFEKVGVALENQSDTDVPVLLRMTDFDIDDTQEDVAGMRDSIYEAGYVDNMDFAPEDIEFWDGEEWVWASEEEPFYADGMQDDLMDAARQETDGEMEWVEVDRDFFRPGEDVLEKQ